MCSIGGFISASPLGPITSKRLLSALLFYGADRGQQSSGVWLDSTGLLKRATPPMGFLQLPEFGDMFDGASTMALTHNRLPTSGGRGDAHAQPFMSDDVISVHNGCVFDSVEIAEEWGLTKDAGVDSQIFNSFVKAYGIGTLPAFLASIHGSAALGIVSPDSAGAPSMHLIRVSNPLYSVTLELGLGPVTIFASTHSILEDSLKYVWLHQRSIRISILEEGVLYQAKPDGLSRVGAIPEKKFKSHFNSQWEKLPNGVYRWKGGAPANPPPAPATQLALITPPIIDSALIDNALISMIRNRLPIAERAQAITNRHGNIRAKFQPILAEILASPKEEANAQKCSGNFPFIADSDFDSITC